MKFLIKERQVTVETDKEVEPKFNLMQPVQYKTNDVIYIGYIIGIVLDSSGNFKYTLSWSPGNYYPESQLTIPQ